MSVKQFEPVLSVKNLSFAYAGNPILDRISFVVEAGDYLGIIGPNGGGKTTLLKLILGLLKPKTGEIVIAKRQRIGYVPQRSQVDDFLFPATVFEVVMSGRTASKGLLSMVTRADRSVVKHAMKTANVGHLSERRIGTLSGGERQRVMIARALSAEPVLLVLDEPTSAVDAPSQESFYAFLKQLNAQGLTIILVSHDVDIITHEVNTVLCLNKHLICHGPARSVMDKIKIVHQH